MTISQIINDFEKNNSGADATMIRLAYDFAVKAHAGQKRKSGPAHEGGGEQTLRLRMQILLQIEEKPGEAGQQSHQDDEQAHVRILPFSGILFRKRFQWTRVIGNARQDPREKVRKNKTKTNVMSE